MIKTVSERPRSTRSIAMPKRNTPMWLLLSVAVLCAACHAGTTEHLLAAKSPAALPAPAPAPAQSALPTAPPHDAPAHNEHVVKSTPASSPGARTMLRVYDECARADGGFVPCLKKKAISFIDRISYIDAITVADGVRLVRVPGASLATSFGSHGLASDNEIESTISMSRSGEDRDTKLTNMLIDRLSQFFNGHSLQVNFPKLTSEEIGRGLEEGRGKMKKMMGMMMMGMAMKMMGMLPLAMGALYMLAGKALIISKIALLLAGIMGLKKLMSGRGGAGGGGGSGGWSAGGGGGGGGWSSGGGGYDRRSLHDVHELAYSAYSKQAVAHQQQQQHQHQPQSLHQPHYKAQPAVPLQQQV